MPVVSFFPFSLVSKATAVCEERSCGPLHSIYGVLAPRSVKADPRFYCPATGSIAHQIANADRKTGPFTYFNFGILIHCKRNAQRFLIFSLRLLCVMDWAKPPIRPTLHLNIRTAYEY